MPAEKKDTPQPNPKVDRIMGLIFTGVLQGLKPEQVDRDQIVDLYLDAIKTNDQIAFMTRITAGIVAGFWRDNQQSTDDILDNLLTLHEQLGAYQLRPRLENDKLVGFKIVQQEPVTLSHK